MSVITACYLIFRSSLDLLQNRTSFQMSVGFVLGFELLSCFKTHPPLSFKVLNCIFSVEQLQNRGTFFFFFFSLFTNCGGCKLLYPAVIFVNNIDCTLKWWCMDNCFFHFIFRTAQETSAAHFCDLMESNLSMTTSYDKHLRRWKPYRLEWWLRPTERNMGLQRTKFHNQKPEFVYLEIHGWLKALKC